MMSHSGVATVAVRSKRHAGALQALAAIGLGLFVVFMVGFSPIEAVHNAAHDVRHSNAFPCH
jgi:cobalt transporter subunit CbtB